MGVNVELSTSSSATPATPTVSVEGLAARVGIDLTDPVAAARAAGVLADAVGTVEDYLRAPLGTLTETVTVDSPHEQVLWLPFRRVQSVSDVLIGVTPVALGDWQLRGDRLWRFYGWRRYDSSLHVPPTVTATVTHGFTALPAGVQAIVYALATSSWLNEDGLRQHAVTQGQMSESMTFASETIGTAVLAPQQEAALSRYRNRRRTSVQLAKCP